MAKIERFEDIEAWQKARELTRQIYDASNDGTFPFLPIIVGHIRGDKLE